jgi:tetratricopeptide (TPR) repeat protein
MSDKRKRKGAPAARPVFFWLACAAAFAGAVALSFFVVSRQGTKQTVSVPPASISPSNQDQALFAAYGKSPSCKSCHEEAYKLWEGSHHALAERPIDPAVDAAAFAPGYEIRHGSQRSLVWQADHQCQIVTTGLDGRPGVFSVQRVIGVEPLRQFLLPAPGGRFQVSELAYDPRHPDWFDVYGEEDRKPGEWGHWTGRGMTWNAMCATCHNTRLRKNYGQSTDSYRTTMAEMGVGCEACHGPMADHNAWQAKHPNQEGDPTVHRIAREPLFAVCGSCHSRRAELTGDFHPGETYADHFALTIPDETDIFYPDGQIRDEDFEFNAFMGSRMRAAGVRCIDCHEPHAGKIRLPGNNLCMVCHAAPAPPAPKIDPMTHSHHRPAERGDNCVDCHMPQTVYMQRHARHDHGFTVPDPLLTKQFGIPNACNRCHTDHDADWSLAAVEKWYGQAMDRPTRARTQVIARGRLGDRAAIPGLLGLLQSETNAYWRAVSVNLLKRWADEPNVTKALLTAVEDQEALVRSASVRALEPLVPAGGEPLQTALRSRLTDAVRGVRVDAAWALHTQLDTNSTAGQDLAASLRHNADQPSGAMQLGVFCLDRGDLAAAKGYLERAVSWDTNSAPLHQALAVALSLEGKPEAAVEELQAACRLAPREAEYQFKLGLALNEAGRLEAACAALEEAVKLDPQLARAWYNLGLAQSTAGKSEEALDALMRAESLDGRSPQVPYARATILARLGRVSEARKAAQRALELHPGYAEAEALLDSLPQ